jgi:hypothetical protein
VVGVAGASRDDLIRRLDETIALLERLPADDPAVVAALAETSGLLTPLALDRGVLTDGRAAAGLGRLAGLLPAGHPMALYARFMALAARYMQAYLGGDPDRAAVLLTELTGSADAVPAGHPFRPYVLCNVAIAYAERHSVNGDLRNLDLARENIDEAIREAGQPGGPFAPGTAMHGFLLHVRGMVRMLRNVYDRDEAEVRAALDDLERGLAQIGPELAAEADLTFFRDTARVMLEQLGTPSGPGRPLGPVTSETIGDLLQTAQTMRPDRVEYAVNAMQAAAGLAMRGLAAGDVTLIDQAIARLAAIAATPGLGAGEGAKALQSHGFALHTRHHMTRDPRDLSNAIGVLEDARRAVEQELGSPYASEVLLSLAFAYRTRGNEALGDVDRAVRTGLDGLREQAGDVLLQDSDDNALLMARRASDDATDMARWFLARGRRAAAIDAIELGRGMVLHAATAGSGVAEALAAAGHQELAAAWTARSGGPGPRDAPGASEPGAGEPGASEPGAGDELRYRAMRALEGTAAEAALLSPPALHDITDALARTAADLLCYLLPQQEHGGGMATGMAVLVSRTGTVGWIPLPRLRTGDGSIAGQYRKARRKAESSPLIADQQAWREMLEATCDWAWDAVVGAVLKAASDSRPPGGSGPPRVVLVPLGELGLIPWHAARRPQAGVGRCACQEAIFRYASSARQLVKASRLAVRPWHSEPVLISDGGDDDRTLPDAKQEVAHLFLAHYGAGKVYGAARDALPASVPGDAQARAADVLAALPHGSSPGASLLHFGCHGTVDLPVLRARLMLGTDPACRADGGSCARSADGHCAGRCEIAVSVGDILRQARRARPDAGEAGALVVLAACLTDVTEADYDEALTLATAFLAAGACGVVAARWAVPDSATLPLMAALHHFLNAGHRDPADALRAAQLWMLDPDREIPAAWPPWLRQRARARLGEAWAWAAFTYQGR